MCGIIGGVGNYGLAGQKMIKMMLLLDQVRGFNSTGIACIDDNDVYTFKKAVHSTDFLEYRTTNDLMDCGKNKAIIGHNRAATKGAVINANSHPFNHGVITGVHNGTLRNQSLLKDHKEFDVDSDNVFYSIDEIGAEPTIALLDGAFTLVWWNEEADTLNFVRNKERPLMYAYSQDGKSFYYASEKWMLQVAAAKCNVKLGEIVELPTGRLMTIDLGLGYNKFSTLINSRVTTKEVKFYEAPVPKKVTPLHRNYGSYSLTFTLFSRDKHIPTTYLGVTECGGNVEVKNYGNKKLEFGVRYIGSCSTARYLGTKPTYCMTDYNVSSKVVDPVVSTVAKTELVVKEPSKDCSGIPELVSWGEKLVTTAKFDALVDKGCCWCGDKDIKDAVVLNPTEYVCGGCKDLTEVQEYIKES